MRLVWQIRDWLWLCVNSNDTIDIITMIELAKMMLARLWRNNCRLLRGLAVEAEPPPNMIGSSLIRQLETKFLSWFLIRTSTIFEPQLPCQFSCSRQLNWWPGQYVYEEYNCSLHALLIFEENQSNQSNICSQISLCVRTEWSGLSQKPNPSPRF